MKRFKKVYIEITNICNLSCNFCPKTKRKLKMTNEERFIHVIEAVKPYTDYIYLHLMGEPLLNPELGKFLAISYENKLKVNITTNGTLLHKVQDTLINSPALRQINISLHSFEANDQVIDLHQYVQGIVDFIIKAREKSNIICSIRLWNMDNEELKGSNRLNTDIISLLEEKLGLDISIREKLQEKPSLKLAKNLYLNMAEKFEWPDMEREIIDEEAFCYGLRDQVGVLVDGTVVPCCLDSEGNIPLGNLFESSMEDILASERAKNLYEGFSNRCAVEELCKRCGYVKRYKK
ncbi:MAG: SPASM domain-containing protein [Cellulosilyticaceae bacterium]